MFGWFNKSPLLDDDTACYLEDAFAWAWQLLAEHRQQLQLILPDPSFFPDVSQSAQQMAEQTLARVLQYSLMSAWPISLSQQPPRIGQPQFAGALLGAQAKCLNGYSGLGHIQLQYHPRQLKQPQHFIAHLAVQNAYLLGRAYSVSPPGGESLRPLASEVLAVALGFGVLITNSVYQFRTGCGSCYDAVANRASQLDEASGLYCLALFGHAMALPYNQLKRPLKGYLHSDFKRAWQQVEARQQQRALPFIAKHKEHRPAQA